MLPDTIICIHGGALPYLGCSIKYSQYAHEECFQAFIDKHKEQYAQESISDLG